MANTNPDDPEPEPPKTIVQYDDEGRVIRLVSFITAKTTYYDDSPDPPADDK